MMVMMMMEIDEDGNEGDDEDGNDGDDDDFG